MSFNKEARRLSLFADVVHVMRKYVKRERMDYQQQVLLADALRNDGLFSFNFSVLLLASCAIATFGLLQNNSAVIIGAMIIAPLVVPLQSLAFGAIEGDVRLFRNAAITIALGSGAALLLAGVLSLVVGIPNYGSEIVARSRPTLLDLGIAIAAGGIGGFARIRPAISATLAGTAIAVALMPPLCVIGIGLAHGDVKLAFGSTLLYITNLLGITLACMVVYYFAGVGLLRSAHRAILVAVLVTIIVGVPLGASFLSLLQQARLEYALKHELLTNTQTFHRVDLVRTDFNWLSTPPEVTMLVRSTSPITSGQVAALESFARFKTRQSFRLVFEVTPIVEVTGDSLTSQ